MRKSKYTEEQIAMALRQAEAGTPAAEICRKLQVTETTFYRWKKKYGGLGVTELRELRQLREENRKLKQVVADLTLDKHILNDALKKNGEPGAPQGRCAVGPGSVPDFRASGMWCSSSGPILGTLPEREVPGRTASEQAQGARCSPGGVWLPPAPYASATRGLARERKASVPALPRGRPGAAAQTPEATSQRCASGRAAHASSAERALGDGLRARYAVQRRVAESPRCRGRLLARMPGSTCRAAIPRRGRLTDSLPACRRAWRHASNHLGRQWVGVYLESS